MRMPDTLEGCRQYLRQLNGQQFKKYQRGRPAWKKEKRAVLRKIRKFESIEAAFKSPKALRSQWRLEAAKMNPSLFPEIDAKQLPQPPVSTRSLLHE